MLALQIVFRTQPYGRCLGWDGVWGWSHFPPALILLTIANVAVTVLFSVAAALCTRSAMDHRLGFRRSIGILAALLWLSAAIFASRELTYFEPWFMSQAVILFLALGTGVALGVSIRRDGLRRWLEALRLIERERTH